MTTPNATSPVVSRLRPGMGTFIAVEAHAPSPELSHAGLEAAYRALGLVERLMHPCRAGSDLAALRGWPRATPLTVHPWTWDTLALCRRLHEDSRGLFDPCLPGSRGHIDDLELGPAHSVIPHAPMTLDLGGIAKGFAVDRAIDALRAAGCDAGLVNAGGDLAVFGDHAREVHCRHRGGASRLVTLRNSALATSDTGGEDHPGEHRGYYDGNGGDTALAAFAAVTAPSAAVADGLTKCLLAGNPRMVAGLLRRYDAQRIIGP